ncbi:MAG: hypothetical protein R2686_00650 [Candidatus Nanopelagicales bacterium]
MAALMAGCSGGDPTTSVQTTAQTPTTSAATPQPPATDTSDPATDFCTAATQWAQSPAAAEAQIAAQSGDAEALIAAYQAWAAPTEAMVQAVPADAPPKVKQAFSDLSESVQAIAEEGGQTQKQANAYGRAQGTVLDYYSQQCG